MELKNKKILVTGGKGFLGHFVCEQLLARGLNADQVVSFSSNDFDLTNIHEVTDLFKQVAPDLVIHAAAAVGGIGKNAAQPGTMYYQNTMMNTMVMEMARLTNVEKYVAIGSGCVYPATAEIPFKENKIWEGQIEPVTEAYGVSKKIQITQSLAYKNEFGFQASVCLPSNLYGPHDHFNLKFGHVIPMLIRKFVEAKETDAKTVTCWGDGSPTRDFIYAEDAAKAIIKVLEYGESAAAYNIGTGIETSIKELVNLIAEIVGYQGELIWDTDKPNGQMRRCYDINRLKKLGYTPITSLRSGLEQTINWFLANRYSFRE